MVNPPRPPTGRPAPGEYADYALPDIERVAGDDAPTALEAGRARLLALLEPLADDEVAGRRYAPGKWTIKEVVGHLADDERIFAYRLLCIARGETGELPGFDEKLYARLSGFEQRPLADVLAEYRSVRAATLTLLTGLPAEAWARRGTVNGYSATVRGLAFHIAGHELRHLESLAGKYLGRTI